MRHAPRCATLHRRVTVSRRRRAFASAVIVLLLVSGSVRADVGAAPAVALSTDRNPIEAAGQHIDAARRTIDVLAYKVELAKVRKALKRAVERGVRVRLVADEDEARSKHSEVAAIRRAGADVRLWGKGKMHAKLIVIDDRVALAGSWNLSRSADDDNLELVLQLVEPAAVAEASASFERVWKKSKPD